MYTAEPALLGEISVRRTGIEDALYSISEIPWSITNAHIRTALKATVVRMTKFSTRTISKFLSLIKFCVY